MKCLQWGSRIYLMLVLSGLGMLLAGIMFGFWTGQTDLGQFFPRILAIGTIASFITAVYAALTQKDRTCHVGSNKPFMLICLFLCAFALGASISARAAWQLAPSDCVAGFVPYSDASDYYDQVLNWPAQTFDAWNSRRPLNSTLNIMEFHLGGSTLLGMLLVRVAFAALAIASFIIVLSSVIDRYAAATTGFVLLIWTWPYAPSTLSEVNGITISCAGYALLLLALVQERYGLAGTGLFALVLAYCFRPYNPFMPAIFALLIIPGLATTWRKGVRTALLAAVVATLLIAILPRTIYLAYGHPEGSPNANTGYTVLGLARGTDWKEASDFIAPTTQGMSEKDKNTLMYPIAIETVKNDVHPLLRALAVNTAKAVYWPLQEFGSAFGLPKYTLTDAKGSARNLVLFLTQRPSIWLSSILVLLSVVLVFRSRRHCMPISLLGGASFIAFFSIAPIVYGDGSWRVAASLFPGLALFAAGVPLGISQMRSNCYESGVGGRTVSECNTPARLANCTATGLVCIVLLSMGCPWISKALREVAKPLANAFVLEIRNDEKPRWLGFNRAVVSPTELVAWAESQEHPRLAEFIRLHGKSLRQLRFENGDYVLVFDSAALSSIAPATTLDDQFRIRTTKQRNGDSLLE